ncbi:carboxypeptidase-like regulatory domain-containing protein, partial [Flavobacterium sp. FBOR7N2.3]
TTTINSFAKINSSSKIEIVSNIDEKENILPKENQKKEPILDSLKNTITGKVIDIEYNSPLAGAIVTIKNTTIETTTDFDGKFKLIIPDSLLTDKIHIIIFSIGYKKTETIIDKSELLQTKDSFIISVEPEEALLGEVIIIKKKRWWQFWKNKFYKH